MSAEHKLKPLISIIIPVYNGADYMREAIDSALAQTYKNFEIIVINDGSTDDTEKIAQSYGDKVRYLKKKNGGVASALNLALKEMRGDYFSWLSHDDAYYPDKLEKQVACLNKLKDKKVILFSDYAEMNSISTVGRKYIGNHLMLEKKPEYALLRGALNGDTILIPRTAFEEYGVFDEKLKTTQDYAKWYEMSKTYKFVHVPEVLIKYRIHKNQDTKKNPKYITEGEMLWIKMISNLSVKDRIRLEGSDFNFYNRMWLFLRGTQYSKTLEFVGEKLRQSVEKARAGKKIVTFVSHSPGNSGAEKAMLNEIDELLMNDILVHVSLPFPGPLEKELEKRGVIYSFMDIRPAIKSRWSVENDTKREIVYNGKRLADLFRIMRPDVVISITSIIFEGAFAAKMVGIPHVWSIVEYGVPEHGIKFLIPEEDRMRLLKNYSKKEIFPSQTLCDYYLNKVELKNFVIIPPISASEVIGDKRVDSEAFSKDNKLKLVIAGYIGEGKGQKDAVLATVELRRQGFDAELVIVGPHTNSKYFREIQKIIKRNNLKNIKILPEVESVIPIIRAADILLMCSVWESFGRVTAEAMLCKKPVIGANSGATPELVNDAVNGFLYEPGNYRDLAEKIMHFIKNKKDIERFGQNGFQFIKEKLNSKTNQQKLIRELSEYKTSKMDNQSYKKTLADIEKIMGLEKSGTNLKSKVVDTSLRKSYGAVNRIRRLRDRLKKGTK